MRLPRLLPLLTLVAAGVPAVAAGQSLEIRAEQAKATIGDPISFELTVRLRPGNELIDVYPRTLVQPPKGIRVLSADTLRPAGNGVYRGKARMAFYRVGPRPVPTLALLYRAASGEPPDTLLHMPISIEITPILEAGNPSLRDIKPLQPLGGPIWIQVAGLAALVGGAFYWLWRRGRKRAGPAEVSPVPLAGPFDAALARLGALEMTARASGNGILPLYSGVADVVRDCLREVGAIPHAGLTTDEVGERLPGWLAAADGRGRCRAVLAEADLVKFARVRPDFPTAADHVARTRSLLEGWRDTVAQPAP